jgi:hypothetical protein
VISELLGSPFVLKLGVGFLNDVEKLCNDHRFVPTPLVWPFYEMQSLLSVGAQPISLVNMVSDHLNLSLDKEQQTSDWGSRPLDAKQLTYAALDAWILLPLFDALFAGRLTHLPLCGLHSALVNHASPYLTSFRIKTREVATDVVAVAKRAQAAAAVCPAGPSVQQQRRQQHQLGERESGLEALGGAARVAPAAAAGEEGGGGGQGKKAKINEETRYREAVRQYLRSLPPGSVVPFTGGCASSE